MEKPLHAFPATNYALSTDYRLLWTLVNELDISVPAWVTEIEPGEEIIWQIVEVKKKREGRWINVGTRASIFFDLLITESTEDYFTELCAKSSLHFIKPDLTIPQPPLCPHKTKGMTIYGSWECCDCGAIIETKYTPLK